MVKFMEKEMTIWTTTLEKLNIAVKDKKANLASIQRLLTAKQARVLEAPKTLARLSEITASIVAEKTTTAQKEERAILSEVFAKPCALLRPTYTVTSALPTITQFTVGPCPVCCNGYYNFNWVPAPCGHTYHPACLFPLVCDSEDQAPSCRACGQYFPIEWMETWGVESEWDFDPEKAIVSTQMVVATLKKMYGGNAERLQQRWTRVVALNAEVKVCSSFSCC
jgi:hypothetical protein